MSDSLTTNLNLIKPAIGGSAETWGTKTNENWDTVDATFPLYLPLTGGELSGNIAVDGSLSAASNQFQVSTAGVTFDNGSAATVWSVSGTGDEVANSYMSASGTFYVASNPNYFFRYNTATGSWEFVSNGSVLAHVGGDGSLNATTVNASGSVTGAYLTSSGNVNAAGAVTCGGLTDSGNAAINGTLSVGSSGISFPGIGAGAHAFAHTWGSNAIYNLYVDGGFYGPIVISNTGGGWSSVYWLGLNGSTATMAAAYSTTQQVFWPVTFSDRALKTNLKPASDDALGLVNRVPVHECDLRPPFDDAVTQHWPHALIADEVAQVLPVAYIAGGTHDGRRSYDTLRELPLIATLWRAVQQLSAEVAALKAT